MSRIDVDKLRDYLMDYCGTAVLTGFPAAAFDLVDVQIASGQELCQMAERFGVDLSRFVVSIDGT